MYERSDAHVAVYPGGNTRFQKHIDNTSADGRVLTVLVYLNPNWNEDDGGALRITSTSSVGDAGAEGDGGGPQVLDIYPHGGRLALFWSANTMHEVLPTKAYRHAVTVWYYDARERLLALKAAQELQKRNPMKDSTASSDHDSHDKARKEASSFIQSLVGDGVIPSPEYIAGLYEKAQNDLSKEALEILAAVTGAPSPAEFINALQRMTPEKLSQLRVSSSPDFL